MRGIERLQRRVLVAGLAGIQAERQEVLLVEADLHGMKIGKGANKKRGPQHEQQRKRDLRDNQELTEADAASMPAWGAGASLLQRRRDIHARGLNGGRESENNTCGERDRDGEGENAPVEFCAKTEILAAAGEQPDEETNPTGRNAQAEDASRQREHHALRKQLPQHAKAACAQTEPYGDFAPPRVGAGQKQVRNIGTGDSENERHHGHQDKERLRILAAQRVDTGAAFLKPERREVRPLFIVSRRGERELMESRGELGLRALPA